MKFLYLFIAIVFLILFLTKIEIKKKGFFEYNHIDPLDIEKISFYETKYQNISDTDIFETIVTTRKLKTLEESELHDFIEKVKTLQGQKTAKVSVDLKMIVYSKDQTKTFYIDSHAIRLVRQASKVSMTWISDQDLFGKYIR